MKLGGFRRQSGQTMVLFAAVLPVLIGASALMTDVGVMYFHQHQLQTAADAAVLAGATFLPLSPDTARSVARSYAATNGLASSEIDEPTVSSDNLSITMTAHRQVPYIFGAIFGSATTAPDQRLPAAATVRVSAKAGLVAAAKVISPTGFPCSYSSSTQSVCNLMNYIVTCPGTVCSQVTGFAGGTKTAVLSAYGSTVSPLISQTGSYLPIDSTYLQNLQTLAVGDSVQTQANVLSNTGTEINSRISAGLFEFPGDTSSSPNMNDPRLVEVPVGNGSSVSATCALAGSCTIPIQGFATIWLNSFDSSNGILTATVVTTVAPDNQPDTTSLLPSLAFSASTPILEN